MLIRFYTEDEYLTTSGSGRTARLLTHSVGSTTIRAAVINYDGTEVTSDIEVSIFKPLCFATRRLLLLPGSATVLQTEGGPTDGASLKFWVEDESIASKGLSFISLE